MPQEGVPRGEVIKMPPWTRSTVFPGTHRDWWLYVPKQYDSSKPACVMVFQDGGGYVNINTNGSWRVPTVFDNLIAKKEMPVTIGVFINPGEVPSAEPGPKPRSNRSFEYDSLGDQYARFLLEEILPEEHPIVPEGFNFSTHIDVLASGNDDDTTAFLKDYADEETPQQFARDLKITLPDHEDPPFPRDHLLPG